ncbi:MAG: hypothetical protein Q7K35_03415 [bacterium]|nr:hypothetical protein [bacterium]
MPKFKIALLCGGPSLERAISLNSARTVLDHLQSREIEILPVYFDHKNQAFLISQAQLYSNTPTDFDFKLSQTATALSQKELIIFLKKADLTFPVIHGKLGEDGEIQKLLEKNNLPFVGSPSKACALAFDKHLANEFIKQRGFYTLPSLALLKNDYREHKRDITGFFKRHKVTRAVIKPATGGSSIAVYSVSNADEALARAKEIFSKGVYDRAVLEPFCQGKEFTVIILENKINQPVAILPTEIELSYKDHQIFDYRKKYLATRQVFYHCPPRFKDEVIFKIQNEAQELFRLFKLRDFARFDGWLEPNGKIWFSDFNPISGMEQNSFLFMQSSRLGFSHGGLLRFIVKNACRRYGLSFPEVKKTKAGLKPKKSLNVIFGGNTAERQVSVMSGTNVWLKLKRSVKYDPQPYLMDTNNQIWRLPYTLTLNHTVEEIAETCRSAKQDEKRLKELTAGIIKSLMPEKNDLTEAWFLPEKMTLKNFIKKSPYVFIGLHGGLGEDGSLQKMLELNKVPFNGSGSAASALCMNKFITGQALASLKKEGMHTARKVVAELNLFKKFKNQDFIEYWKNLLKKLGSNTAIVKPLDDGCSAGIARLFKSNDLKTYLDYAFKKTTAIPQDQLTNQYNMIEMPACPMNKIMFEEYITTDKIQIIGNKLTWLKNTDWIEITMGLLENKGKMRALNPSLTVALGNVLTLEEKFQGGTGINITPPPAPYVSLLAIEKAKIRIEKVAKTLGLRGYARVDAFMNIKNGELIIIEANTLPGLTPATVIYHQALAEKTPLYPVEFLEKIVGNNY